MYRGEQQSTDFLGGISAALPSPAPRETVPRSRRGLALGLVGVVVAGGAFISVNEKCLGNDTCAKVTKVFRPILQRPEKVTTTAVFSPASAGGEPIKKLATFVLDPSLPLLLGRDGLGVGVKLDVDQKKLDAMFVGNEAGKPKKLDAASYSAYEAKYFKAACVADLNQVVETFKAHPRQYIDGTSVTTDYVASGQSLYSVAPTTAVKDNPTVPNIYVYDHALRNPADPSSGENRMLGCIAVSTPAAT